MTNPFMMPPTGFGPGSQPLDNQDEALEYMPLPQDMRTYSPRIPEVEALGEADLSPALDLLHDVARAAVMGVLGQAKPGIYELGGPDVHTFRELMVEMLGVIRRRRLVVNIPFWAAGILARLMELGQTLTFGLVSAQITRDQVANLRRDNVVAPDAKGFTDLGISPVSMEAVLPDYLWRFRPSGQYSEIKESAKNLRTR